MENAKNLIFGKIGNVFGILEEIFGSRFIIGWRKTTRTVSFCQKQERECQKFSFWQRDRDFWHFGAGFWQTTDVRIVRKPINRAFEGVSVECQKFSFWKDVKRFLALLFVLLL